MPPPPPPPRRPTTGAAAKEENIYIPSFISKRPFYAGAQGDDADYLEHQRKEEKAESKEWYDRGRKRGPAATKYRKGACENCGAMTHGAKDCLSRPRARGARWSGQDIQADEVVQDIRLGWDAKRDRWNGYDAREYRKVVDEYNEVEKIRKDAKRALKRDGGDGEDDEDDDDDDDEGDKYAEANDMSKHQSTATRQLRIREDTAKYLLNLDLESAKYDPKTRSLVNAGATADRASELYAEEGFLKASGEAAEFERAQRFAWEAQEERGDTGQHLQANPTAGEFSRKKEAEEMEAKRAEREKKLLAKYGGGGGDQKALPAALRNMAVTESERFVEYDEAGLVKGAPKQVAKSKYAEDILTNNHTSVWGSWWSNFKWGYKCCHSIVKNSYCTGEEGKAAWEAAEQKRSGANLLEDVPEEEPEPEKDAAAEKEEQAKKKRTREEMLGGVTEAEMDEYRRKKTVANDPMANLLGKDELLS